MAMYIPPGRKRRRLLLWIGASVLVGLVLGGILGRITAPTVEDKINSARDDAAAAVAQLQALPLEYEKQLSGSSQFKDGGGVDDALARTRGQLDEAISNAPWITPTQIDAVHKAIDGLRDDAASQVTGATFQRNLDQATETITTIFGA
jgi:F0F1-type ATP synthase membrane subunit b/b'